MARKSQSRPAPAGRLFLLTPVRQLELPPRRCFSGGMGKSSSEFQPLIDQLYLEEVEEARRLGEAGRFRCGLEIIHFNLEWLNAMGADERDRRLEIAQRLADQGCYALPQHSS